VYGLGGGWDHELVGTAMLYSRELVTAIASSVRHIVLAEAMLLAGEA
jgi:hypothetical protein